MKQAAGLVRLARLEHSHTPLTHAQTHTCRLPVKEPEPPAMLRTVPIARGPAAPAGSSATWRRPKGAACTPRMQGVWTWRTWSEWGGATSQAGWGHVASLGRKGLCAPWAGGTGHTGHMEPVSRLYARTAYRLSPAYRPHRPYAR